jgi:hypothetical protein
MGVDRVPGRTDGLGDEPMSRNAIEGGRGGDTVCVFVYAEECIATSGMAAIDGSLDGGLIVRRRNGVAAEP